MGVDIIDVFGVQPCGLKGALHGAEGPAAVFGGGGDVVGVSGAGSTQDLSQDAGTPGLGHLPVLQDKHAGAFTHDESVSLSVEGATDPDR